MNAKHPEFNQPAPTTATYNRERSKQSGALARNVYPGSPEFTLLDFLKRLFYGVAKFYVAFKFQVYQTHQRAVQLSRLLWFRLGVLTLAALFLFKEDIRLSVSMNAPAGIQESRIAAPATASQVDQLSLAQSVGSSDKPYLHRAASATQLEEYKAKEYIERFARVAVAEMQKFGIPASIKLAQGLSESWAGEHLSATDNNNHFGQPLEGMHYPNAWENWRQHSLLIRQEYPQLMKYGRDYQKWASGLQQLGYSPDPNYARKLTGIIERYQLDQLDNR